MKCVVVTGVSSGIGRGTAEELISCGFRVFGSVRRPADADRVRSALGAAFEPLLMDVTDSAAVADAAARVEEEVGDGGLAGLVNNAGIAVSGPLLHVPLEDVRRQFEVNVVGVLRVTQAFAPLLGARRDPPHRPGRIVNISSVSGRVALPFVGPYAASKHAVEALSDSLRRELLPYGIDVIVIEPGPIDTAIWEKLPDLARYDHTDYAPLLARAVEAAAERKRRAMPVSVVARVIRRALTARRPKARYALPLRRLGDWWLPRLLPDRWLDRLVARHVRW